MQCCKLHWDLLVFQCPFYSTCYHLMLCLIAQYIIYDHAHVRVPHYYIDNKPMTGANLSQSHNPGHEIKYAQCTKNCTSTILPEILQHLHMWMLPISTQASGVRLRACNFARAATTSSSKKYCKLSLNLSCNAILASTTFCCRIHNPSFTVSYFDLAHTTQQSFQSHPPPPPPPPPPPTKQKKPNNKKKITTQHTQQPTIN